MLKIKIKEFLGRFFPASSRTFHVKTEMIRNDMRRLEKKILELIESDRISKKPMHELKSNIAVQKKILELIESDIASTKKIIDLMQIGNINSTILIYNQIHYRLLEKLRKKVKDGGKAKVFFLIDRISTFPEKTIYDIMLNSELFEPYIFLFRRDTRFYEAKENFEIMKEKGYQCIYAYDETHAPVDLNNYKPDILFYNTTLLSKGLYRPDVLNCNYLVCYIPYHSGVIDKDGYHIKHPNAVKAWINFANNSEIYNRFLESTYLPLNTVYFGYPKLDAYMDNTDETSMPDKFSSSNPCVIYAPHWSIETSNDLATFHIYHKYFFSLMLNNPNINFIFKPHPELPRRIREHGSKVGINTNEYLEYYCEWNNMSNGYCVIDGEYIGLFKKSRCLITDSASFVGEWLPSGNPCIIIVNTKKYDKSTYYKKFMPHAQRILDTYYLAYSENEIQELFDKIVINGIDEKYEERVNLSKELFPNLGNASKNIVDYITRQIKENI